MFSKKSYTYLISQFFYKKMENFYNNPYKSILNSYSTDIIKIELNKDFYSCGQTVEGNIIFDNMKNININKISIVLYQKSSWFVQETAEIKYGEKHNKILSKQDINIKSYLNNNELLLPGKYIFPFKIQLPEDLEPSLEYPYPNRYAYLRYSLQCEFNPNLPEFKNQKFILIKSTSPNIITQKSFSSITNVHKWGFLDGGTTSLKVSYEKNNYRMHDIIPLNVIIDNSRGKLKVKMCKIRVMRTIEFSKLEEPFKYPMEKTINSQEFNAEVLPYQKNNFIFQIKLIDNDLINFKYLQEENPYPNINDINILLPTMNSKIIKCDYRLQVSLYFDNFVTSGYRPRVKLPLIISHFIEDFGNKNNYFQGNNIINNNYYNDNLINSNSHINESSLIFDQNYINNRNNIINNEINNNININNINENKDDNLAEYIKSKDTEKGGVQGLEKVDVEDIVFKRIKIK